MVEIFNFMRNLVTFSAFVFVSVSSVYAQFWKTSDPVRLEGSVNSDAEENMPVFSQDSSILYFVRTFHPDNTGGEADQDIWFSTRDEESVYTESKRVSGINNKFNNAVVGLGNNGNTMYLFNAYEGKKDMKKGIAYSTKNNGGWSAPKKLEIPGLVIEGDFYGFHVGAKEDVIILSYAGTGSLGEEDLFFSKKVNGNWTVPQHMGATINSTGFEISPFLSKNQDTLFFSSNGFGGAGDADIFYSVRQGDWNEWSQPINLGEKINSSKFDAYFVHSGSHAYWSSNRDAQRSDIYMVHIFQPPPLSIECIPFEVSSYKGEDGRVDVKIHSGAEPYTYEWSTGSTDASIANVAKGEYSVTVRDDVGQIATTTCFVDEPPMPIAPVDVVEYTNVTLKHTFGYNKNKLSISRGDLKRFIKEVEEQLDAGRNSVTIHIVSSASHVPTKMYGSNENLARIRAENVKYDLVSYFSRKSEYTGKVNVVVLGTKVDGPSYEEDAENKAKYEPFQFVELTTE